ncbi:hypothetical protein EVAR_31073_1 [Eumeta japonica]|uniref:Uncharacterized protein n=1 Tax=Eumeta variegata TaxID=151549 RepID=A0A4C1XHT3_EUMVA|nr:hypothetical protein EVAR_31073_1 [Eumeta japonica]
MDELFVKRLCADNEVILPPSACELKAIVTEMNDSVKKRSVKINVSKTKDEAPSKTTGYHWFSEFNRERFMLTDEFKEGRPKSVVAPQNIDAVKELMMQDRHITYHEIKASLDEIAENSSTSDKGGIESEENLFEGSSKSQHQETKTNDENLQSLDYQQVQQPSDQTENDIGVPRQSGNTETERNLQNINFEFEKYVDVALWPELLNQKLKEYEEKAKKLSASVGIDYNDINKRRITPKFSDRSTGLSSDNVTHIGVSEVPMS